ncbi:MAG: ABC transporter ATP-binding protein/permease [Afipia sp.]|nr:ABC transporter ATP-binding protein/permease [Afipia sp.]
MNGIGSTIAAVWRVSIPYFRSDDRWAARGLLAAVIALELGSVAISVLLNTWNNRFYNALQERNWDNFVYELSYFTVLAMIFIAIAVYQLYLNQWLQIRWRSWMTTHYLTGWLHHANHYRMQLQGDAADNPDQRITDDVKLYVDRTLNIGIGVLSSIVTLFSFVVILWSLSNAAPLHLFGRDIDFPGYMVWGALIYSALGTWLTHLIGWPLVGLDFRQQKYEADFRFNLVRVRENSEQIALLHGEIAERDRLLTRFGLVFENWLGIMVRTKKITAFTSSYSQASVIFPYVLVAPAYFAEKIQLGGMMQTASAFGSVQGALSFFISVYRQLAEWQAVVARLDGFEAGIDLAESLAANPSTIRIVPGAAADKIEVHNLAIRLPNGDALLDASNLTFRHGERTLVTGPSGAGKSTLLRAIAGIWPFGSGAIEIPQDATLMTLPQRPYFPVGALSAAISYPAKDGSFSAEKLREVLTQVGLPALAAKLNEDGHWNRTLSLGEQQRLGIARALLQTPQYLFLDEATASLDEPSEAMLYGLIAEKLPATTVISIGHRTTLEAFHQRQVGLVRSGARFTIGDESGSKPA